MDKGKLRECALELKAWIDKWGAVPRYDNIFEIVDGDTIYLIDVDFGSLQPTKSCVAVRIDPKVYVSTNTEEAHEN
jgi:hypothetical protein